MAATAMYVLIVLGTLICAVGGAAIAFLLVARGWDMLPAFGLIGAIVFLPAYGAFRLWRKMPGSASNRYGPALVSCTTFLIAATSEAINVRNAWRSGTWHYGSLVLGGLVMLIAGWSASSGLRSARRNGSTNSRARTVIPGR